MSANQEFRQPPVCKVFVDDEEITDIMHLLVEATVETERRQAAVCTLVFDAVRLEDETWMIQDAGIFVPWKSFRIEADFGDYSEEVMRGYVKEVRADTPERMGESKVLVLCQDESILLDRQHLRKAWSREDESMSDGDIVREIAGSNFEVDVEDGLTNTTLYQDGTSVQLLRDRADANGFEFYIREGKLRFGPPQLDCDPQAAIMLNKGERTNCLRFSLRHDGHKPDQINISLAAQTGTDIESDEFVSNLKLLGNDAATSENMGLESFVWQMPRPSGATLEEIRSRAQAKANEMSWKIVADGELDGSLYGHVLLTDMPVGVYGVGDTYGGLYYVDKVTHIFARNGYRQSFRLLRNATGRNTEPEQGDALAGVR